MTAPADLEARATAALMRWNVAQEEVDRAQRDVSVLERDADLYKAEDHVDAYAAGKLDGKTAEIREAQLVVLLEKSTPYVSARGRADDARTRLREAQRHRDHALMSWKTERDLIHLEAARLNMTG